jgi:N-acetylglutamate synthase-like GNAT family acetyltransferase
MTAGRLEMRPAREDDLDAIRRLVRDAYAIYVSRIGREPAPMGADYEEVLADGAMTVAVDDGELVGVLVLRPQPRSLLVENVAVAPAAQRRGVGRALMAFAEERARGLGVATITLYTNVHMTENLSFYPALGYNEVDRRHEEGFDRVYFEKAFDRKS